MNSLYALVALALAFQTGAPVSELPPKAHSLAQGRWEIDYGNTKCRLIRHFIEAGQPYRLTIDRDWTFGGYQWALYGSALPLHSSMRSVEIALGENEDRRLKLKSYAVTEGEERLGWADPDGLLFNSMREGDRFQIRTAKNLGLSLNLNNLAAAVKGLEKCEDDMWGSWGFDPRQIRSLSKRAEPSTYRWVTNNDYPRVDFFNRNEGITSFLLNVDATGAVTHCRIIDSSGFLSLDKRACSLLMTRAAFDPARDADGNPVASYYINRVRWEVPR